MITKPKSNYQQIALDARKKVLSLIYKAQTSHIGSNFSVIDIMTVLFENINLVKDKVILSKGWAAASLYYFLWRKGKISKKQLDSYCMPGSRFIGLAEPIISDIPFSGGSVGMGIPAGVGFAISKKLKEDDGIINVIESDGGLNVGMVWESALIASHHKLNNLVVWIDNNSLQAMGESQKLLKTENIENKFKSFGWHTQRINGHSFNEILKAYKSISFSKPNVIIADTVKGHPITFMLNNNFFHYARLTNKMYRYAKKEIGL